ncbi:MAG: hypothetical protein NT027_19805 [Proteobacteria bacterium]|nr:hypothetical protein [Pseudomonadota bacterium]
MHNIVRIRKAEMDLRSKKATLVRKAVQIAGSISALSRILGVPRQSIALWMRGHVEPEVESLARVAKWLNAPKKLSHEKWNDPELVRRELASMSNLDLTKNANVGVTK